MSDPSTREKFRLFRKKIRRRTHLFLVRWFGPLFFRTLEATWKVKRAGLENGPESGEPLVYAIWHESIPIGVPLLRKMGLCVMVSHHHDGELIERVIRRFGYLTARGSSTRGGVGAIRKMLRDASVSNGLVITPDGPQGPAHTIAPGLFFVAAVTRRPMVAIGYASSKSWRVTKSWDKMIFPKPGAKVGIAFSKPFHVPRNVLEDEQVKEEAIANLAQAFEDAHKTAEELIRE
ncbi:MAG: lysophospholipid acyltransferase family protein [Planctomycetota bacterium]|jgi:hypothetical protein|nr:lysophospholipid acyltransferase family protein [Planctomycetota bacterium]MDP6940941.1 lysophospholipid acyltransferase family protein [Planctomycetota bacterium]